MKKTFAFIAGLSLCLIVAPFQSRASDTAAPSPSPSPSPTVAKGKKNKDINAFLDAHPKMKAKILAKFDTNHNGVLDGDEITAFQKWRKENRAAKQAAGGGKAGAAGQTTTTTPPAITSPNVQ